MQIKDSRPSAIPTSFKDIMLGYMTAKEALAAGFTNHGSYFGIPLWMTDEECPMVATKWMPMEYVMSLFHYIEGFLQMMNPEPGFHFYIGPPIEQ